MLDFLLAPFKSRKSRKIHQLLRQLVVDLAPAPGDLPGNFPWAKSMSSISDGGGCGACVPEDEGVREKYADLEEFLASATTGKQFDGKPVRVEDVEKCLSVAIEQEVILAIAMRIGEVPTELRRVGSNIWNLLLKLQDSKKRYPVKDYLESKLSITDELLTRYTDNNIINTPSVFVTIGVMMRDTFIISKKVTENSRKYIIDRIFPIILNTQKLNISFDVSADAFSTMRDLLLLHKASGAAWLAENFSAFFADFRALVLPVSESDNQEYVTVRQGAWLLSSLVLDRAYVSVMMQIVQDTEMLKAVLMLLSHKSRVIELEAFHVLKVFIANPRKISSIKKILAKNANRIIKILERIEEARADDKEFLADKRVVVNKLTELEKEHMAAVAAAQLTVSNSEGECPRG
jgi:calcium binding protein 39